MTCDVNINDHPLTRSHIKVWVDGKQTKKALIISVLDAEQMARNKDLSNFDKCQIIMAREMGQSISESAAVVCGLLLVSSGKNLPTEVRGGIK